MLRSWVLGRARRWRAIPEALRRYLDTWRDRLDPDYSWIVEQDYLRDSGQTEGLASQLVAARGKFITDAGLSAAVC